MKKFVILSCLCFLSFSYEYDDKYYGKNANKNEGDEKFYYGDDKFYVKGHYYYNWINDVYYTSSYYKDKGTINVNTNVYQTENSTYYWKNCNQIGNLEGAQNYKCYTSSPTSAFINNDNDPYAFYDTNIEFYWNKNPTECYSRNGNQNNSFVCTPTKFLSSYIRSLKERQLDAVFNDYPNDYYLNNIVNYKPFNTPFTYYNLINSGFYNRFEDSTTNFTGRLQEYFNKNQDNNYPKWNYPKWRDPGYAPSQINGFYNPTHFNNGQKFHRWSYESAVDLRHNSRNTVNQVWGAHWDGTIFFHPNIILGRAYQTSNNSGYNELNDFQIYSGNNDGTGFNFHAIDFYDSFNNHRNGLNNRFQLAVMVPKDDRSAGSNWNIDIHKMSLSNPGTNDIKSNLYYHFDANTANNNLQIINDPTYSYSTQTIPSLIGAYDTLHVFGSEYSIWILPGLFSNSDLQNGAYLRFKLNYETGQNPNKSRGIFLTWRYVNTFGNSYGGHYPTIFAPIPPAAFVPTRDTVRVVEETFVDKGKSKDNAINFMMRSPLLNKYAGKSTKRYCLVSAQEDLINKRLLRNVIPDVTYNPYSSSYACPQCIHNSTEPDTPDSRPKQYFVKITNITKKNSETETINEFIWDKTPIYDPNKNEVDKNKDNACFTLPDEIATKPGKVTFAVYGQRTQGGSNDKNSHQDDINYANKQSKDTYINDYNIFYIQPFAYRVSFNNESFNVKKHDFIQNLKTEKMNGVFELSDNNAISWNYLKSNGSSDINKKQLDAFLNSNINLRPGIPYDNVLITPIKYNETNCPNRSGNNCISGQLSVIEDYYPKFEYNPEILSDTKNIDVAKSYVDKKLGNITGFDSGKGSGNSILPGISVEHFGYNKPSPYLLPIIENNKHCYLTQKIEFTKNGYVTDRYRMNGEERQGLKYKISVFDMNNDKLFKDSEFGNFVDKIIKNGTVEKNSDEFKKFKHELETYGYRCKLRPALKTEFEKKLGLTNVKDNEAISCDSDRTIPSTATFVPKIEFNFTKISAGDKKFIYSNIFDQTSVDLSPNPSTIANLDISLRAVSTEDRGSTISNFDKDCAATDVYAELNFNNGSNNNGSAKEQKIVFDENYPSDSESKDSKLKFDFLSDGIKSDSVKQYSSNGQNSKRFYPDNKVGYKIPADLFTNGSASITIGVGFDKEIKKNLSSPQNPFKVNLNQFKFTKIAFYNTSNSNKNTEEKPVNFYEYKDGDLNSYNHYASNNNIITVLNGRAYLNDDGYSPASGDPRYGISGNAPGFSRDIKYAFYCNNCGNGFDRFKGEGLGSKQNNWFVNKLETNGGDYIKTHLKSDSNSNSIEYGLTVDHPNTITIRHNNSNGSISEGKESILFSGSNGTKGILTLDLTKRPWFVGVDLNTPSNFNINDYIKQKISIQFGGITKPVWGGTNVSVDGKGKDKIGVGGYVGEDINVPLNNRKGRIDW